MLENIKWFGQAAIKISGEKIIYIDPWKIREDEKADLILITHEHFDHCSPEDVEKIQKEDTVIVTVDECEDKLKGDIKIVKPGDKIEIKGIQIEAVAAYNLNKNFHQKNYGWVGFIITIDGQRIYHAGDTDFIHEMKDIKADIVFLPVGGTYTMNPEEAAQAVNTIRPRIAVPIHWGDIVGSRQDAEKFKSLVDVDIEVVIMEKS